MKNQSSEIIFALGLAGLGLSTAMFYESYLKRKAARNIKQVEPAEYVKEYREVYKTDMDHRNTYLDTLQEHYELQIEELRKRREEEEQQRENKSSEEDLYLRHYAKDRLDRKLGVINE
jgi:hypothetical protein